MEPKTLLITGFMPFGSEDRNPSWEAVSALPERIGDWLLKKLLLPVEFSRAADLAEKAAEDCHADAILSVGLAAGRTAVTPEYVGVNVRDASIPDNAGVQPEGEPVDPDGPAAYFSTLPVREMTKAIQGAGVPAKLSYTAGTALFASAPFFRHDGTRRFCAYPARKRSAAQRKHPRTEARDRSDLTDFDYETPVQQRILP